MVIGIICGYDLHTELDEYVRSVAPVIADERCDVVIFSGGRTSPLIDDSEARAMSRHLSDEVHRPVVVLEERAMTTLDNILYSGHVAEHLFPITRYVVVCDRVHAPKAVVLSALLLRRRFHVRSVSRPTKLKVLLFEPVSLLVEVVAALVPPLRNPLRSASRRLKGLSEETPRSARQEAA